MPSKCEHNRQKCRCKECGGSAICQHNREKYSCKECKGHTTTMCYTLGSRKYKGYCVRCFQHFFPNEPAPKNFRIKENVWADYISDNFKDYDWEFNRTVEDGYLF